MGTFIKGFKIGNVVKKYFVDDTLTEAEYPPSAKKVGDEISELDGQITDLKSDLNFVSAENGIQIVTPETTGYIATNGTEVI